MSGFTSDAERPKKWQARRDSNPQPLLEKLHHLETHGDLVELALCCLRPHGADRPEHAGEIAQALQIHREQADRRAREAEVEARKESSTQKLFHLIETHVASRAAPHLCNAHDLGHP